MKIRVLPYQPHCFAFGGFEIQMISTTAAIRSVGADIAPLDVWSRDADFDVLHVWGFGEIHSVATYWANRTGKAVVMTALLPTLSRRDRVKQRLTARLPSRLRQRHIADHVDILVTVNEASARTAALWTGLPPERIGVAPGVIDDAFFHLESGGLAADFGVGDFVLCAGNICQRKNQLRLAQAAASIGTPTLFLGNVLPDETEYGDRFARFVAGCPFLRWERDVAFGSERLLAAYAQCRAFAMPSFHETQPLAALEAVAAGKPVMMADRAYAHQRFYQNACLVDPADEVDIARGLATLGSDPARCTVPLDAIADCRRSRVGEAYTRIFERALTRAGRRVGPSA